MLGCPFVAFCLPKTLEFVESTYKIELTLAIIMTTPHIQRRQNITIYFLLWKESLNSDDQQFHKYQQNEQSHLNTKKGWYKGQYASWCLFVYCVMVVHIRHVILHSVFACYKRYDWNLVQTIKVYIKIQYNVTIKSLNL